jgi:hypothetical protein
LPKETYEAFLAGYAAAEARAEVLKNAIIRATDNRAGGCVYVDKQKILKEALKAYEQKESE